MFTEVIIFDAMESDIKSFVKYKRRENIHLAIDLQLNYELQPDNERSQKSADYELGAVLSLLIVPQQLSLIIGLLDGRMILFSLNNMQYYHLAHPPDDERSPLIKLAYLEPDDDPRACIYVWAMHSNGVGVMHSVTFEQKDNSSNVHMNFQSCYPKFTLNLMEDKGCNVVGVQSISRNSNYGEEEDVISFFAISYDSLRMRRTVLLLFDLNQWYKEQMPQSLKIIDPSISFCLYSFGDKQQGLDIWMDINSVIPFESIQRPEEHFYPNSFSFEIFILFELECDCFTWMGLQNYTLNLLKEGKSLNIYAPDITFANLMKATLIPRFWDDLHDSTVEMDISVKREFILSIALEYNCISVLKDCIKSWSEGSYLTHRGDGVYLTTITDWLCKYSKIVQTYSDSIVSPLFEHPDQLIDYRTKKNLGQCTKELKILFELMELAMNENKSAIMEEASETLLQHYKIIKNSHDYLEIIQWLLNTGILPEGHLISYPRESLQNYYTSLRYKFRQLDHSVRMSAACRYLYIDTFIQNDCNPRDLLTKWKSSYGLYPPASIYDLLQIMTTKTSNEIKYTIILYFFLDLTDILNAEGVQANLIDDLIKFPSVFKLSPSIIKRTQAFWNFDHGYYEVALDELFSPNMGKTDTLQWECEFLIESLILQGFPQLALRVMRSQGSYFVNPLLEMRTLLLNNCISEAFQMQRVKNDRELLIEFFKSIFSYGKWDRLLDLALSESEGDILCEFLNQINSSAAQNFHIVYLLQRQNFIEAKKLIEILNQKRNNSNLFERPKIILSTYNSTVSPIVDDISKSYFQFYNSKLPEKSKKYNDQNEEEPFSSQLIRNSFNLQQNFHKKAFDSIDKCKIDSNKIIMPNLKEKPKSLKIPFLTKPFSSRVAFEKVSQSKLIIPTLIDKNGKRKPKFDSEIDDRPRKRFLNENLYKTNLLTNFKDRPGYDFSESIEKWTGFKSSTKIDDTIFRFQNETVNNEPPIEVERNYTNIEKQQELTTSEEDADHNKKVYLHEDNRITAEKWNSTMDLTKSCDIVMTDVNTIETETKQDIIEGKFVNIHYLLLKQDLLIYIQKYLIF